MSTATVRSGKAGWVGEGKPNATHFAVPRLRVSTAHQAFVRTRVPGERGENCTQADFAFVVASSAASGDVTFTIRAVAERVPWSNLTWNTRPSIAGASVTVTLTDPAPGDVVLFEMAALGQLAIDGTHYGWRIVTDSADVVRLYGFDTEDGPTLTVTTTEEPAAATDQVPHGVGSKSKPFLQWSAPDLNGGDDQIAFQVQVAATAAPAEDAEGTWTAPAYDSGTVADPTPELDLSATAYAGVADGGEFYWQVRWQSETGLWSPWSDTAHYERDAKETLTVVNPTVGEVDDSQPVFEATYSGTLKAWRASLALVSAPNRIIATSRKQRATNAGGFTWQAEDMVAFVGQRDPITLADGEDYRLTLEAWGADEGRVASVGDPVQVREVVDFTVNEDTGVEAPVLVSVTEDADLPIAELTFTRSTMPDTFEVVRNGRTVVVVDADDAHVVGTTYRAVDALAAPMREHDYQVRARVEGAGRSATSGTIAATIAPVGVWLLSRDLTRYVKLTGTSVPAMARGDEAGVFRIQGRDGEIQHVVVRSGRGKVDSGIDLDLDDLTRPLEASLADLEAIWASDEPAYLVAANKALLVRVLDASHTPHEITREGQVRDVISLRYVEVG